MGDTPLLSWYFAIFRSHSILQCFLKHSVMPIKSDRSKQTATISSKHFHARDPQQSITKRDSSTHPTPAQEALLVLHFYPFLLFLWQLHKEVATFSDTVLNQLIW